MDMYVYLRCPCHGMGYRSVCVFVLSALYILYIHMYMEYKTAFEKFPLLITTFRNPHADIEKEWGHNFIVNKKISI